MTLRRHGIGTRIRHGLITLVGATLLTLGVFLVLPLMQTISTPPERDLNVSGEVEVAEAPPPPPQIEEERKHEVRQSRRRARGAGAAARPGTARTGRSTRASGKARWAISRSRS